MSTAESVEGSLRLTRVVAPGETPRLRSTRPVRRRPRASRASRAAARELKSAANRRTDIPIRKSFVRPMTSATDIAPLAEVYRGGRSGVVAIKLYLAIVWRCSSSPWTTAAPARAWATLLNLDDPDGAGARRVKNGLKSLAAAGLIEVTPNPGQPSTIRILDESGDGRPYRLPSTAYTKKRQSGATPNQLAPEMYFKVPTKLWTQGYIQDMTGPALVMLLILLAEKGGEGEPVWFSTTEFPRRYSISSNSRATGTRELRELGLLSVRAESLADASKKRTPTFETRRRRKVYELTPTAQITRDDVLAESDPSRIRTKPGSRKRPARRAVSNVERIART